MGATNISSLKSSSNGEIEEVFDSPDGLTETASWTKTDGHESETTWGREGGGEGGEESQLSIKMNVFTSSCGKGFDPNTASVTTVCGQGTSQYARLNQSIPE